jgi:hypothetical protein
MKLRVLFLLCASLLITGIANAECVDCFTGYCIVSYSNGTGRVFEDAPYCSTSAARDKGYENCRDVGDCRGCIGWTCVTRDPQVMAKERMLKLVTSEIIRVVPSEKGKH